MDILSFLLGFAKGKGMSGSTDEIDDVLDAINGEVVGETVYTVTFVGADGNTLCEVKVAEGELCPDPVKMGLIDKPTKASTNTHTYSYSGWSVLIDLLPITGDVTIYPVFKESERKYTVKFYDRGNLVHTATTTYGGSVTYDYNVKRENYLFTGWLPEPTNILANTTCEAQWEESYTFANASWEYIGSIAERGMASSAFALGDTKEVELMGEPWTLEIVAFDHDDLADGSGKAGITIVTKNRSASKFAVHEAYTGNCPWSACALKTQLDIALLQLPVGLLKVMKPVTKKSKYKNGSYYSIDTSIDSLWIPSASEAGLTEVKRADGGTEKVAETIGNNTTYFEGAPYPHWTIRRGGYGVDTTANPSLVANIDTRYWVRTSAGDGKWNCVSHSLASGATPARVNTAALDADEENAYLVVGFCI